MRRVAGIFQRMARDHVDDTGAAHALGLAAGGAASGKMAASSPRLGTTRGAPGLPAAVGKGAGSTRHLATVANQQTAPEAPDATPSSSVKQSRPDGEMPIGAQAARVPQFSTCDLCDAHPGRLADGSLAVLPPLFKSYGKRDAFAGKAATLKVFHDNRLVRNTLETQGDGRVLVIDGNGSVNRALVGGNLGVLAEKNDWAGLVVYGAIRDVVEINACDTGVRALASHPRRSERNGTGESEVPVLIAGVIVAPGDWVYADPDGVLISCNPLHDQTSG